MSTLKLLNRRLLQEPTPNCAAWPPLSPSQLADHLAAGQSVVVWSYYTGILLLRPRSDWLLADVAFEQVKAINVFEDWLVRSDERILSIDQLRRNASLLPPMRVLLVGTDEEALTAILVCCSTGVAALDDALRLRVGREEHGPLNQRHRQIYRALAQRLLRHNLLNRRLALPPPKTL